MLPEVWGPPHWDFFHTFSENIHESVYPQMGPVLFLFFVRICRHLPCPECSAHASRFLGKIKVSSLRTKTDLKNLMYVFHNFVNKRKNKPMFPQTELEHKYQKKNVVYVFKRFLSVFNTRGNMNLLSESFQRDFVIRDLKLWFRNSIHHFLPLASPLALPLALPTEDLPTEPTEDLPTEPTEDFLKDEQTM